MSEVKRFLVGYMRKSKSGKMLNIECKYEALDGLQTYEGKDGQKRVRFGLFEEDIQAFLAGKAEYVRVIQLQDD